MSHLLRCAAPLALVGLLLAGVSQAQGPTDTSSVLTMARQHAREPSLSGVTVSPGGKRVAQIAANQNGRRVVGVFELPFTGEVRVVGGFSDANVNRLFWITDGRLVYDAYEPGAQIRMASTMAVDVDGRNSTELINWTRGGDGSSIGSRQRVGTLPYGWTVVGSPQDGSPDVFLEQDLAMETGDYFESRLSRLDTVNGMLTPLSVGSPDRAVARALDAKGVLRVVLTQFNGRARLHARNAEGGWDLLEDHDQLSDDVLTPHFVENDGQLIVSTRRGHDTLGLHSYDLAKRRLDPEPLLRLSRFDIGGPLVDVRAGRVIGAYFETDSPQRVWFSPRVAAVQKAIDAALPGRFNELRCSHCESADWFVVFSSSDRHPGEYLLYHHSARTLRRLGAARPWIDAAQQGVRSFHRAVGRDGLSLPMVMTHPPGRDKPEAMPAIVLVHGGPFTRGSDLGWSAEPQFLARRGWRVLEVEFRGSTGFGARHMQAGFRQWGQAMQDDLADAVQWAAREGWIDPKRVCIAGGSYGGYAALMGPVRHPQTYRCAASFAGVTDLQLMFTSARSDLTDQGRRFGLPRLLGDPVADAEMLRQHSPVARVADLKVPVLLAWGGLDKRVPLEHAERFEAAARRAGVDFVRVSYPTEGHGFFIEENHADYLVRLDAFFARVIGRAEGVVR
jgi:dienelactone hydrolase